MRNLAKRGFSALLALVLCFGLLAGVSLPQAEAASYVYNWGARGDVADEEDFTRSSAEEWYAAEGVTYEELAQLSGSANTSSVTSSALYQKLRKLMQGAVTDTTSYEDIKTLCMYTDCQNGGGKISSFYSGKEIGPSWDGSWNREHTWPNSKGDANGNGENDIFMVRPTHTSENSSRGNTAYGESGSYYNPNRESGGQYDLRGDVARIVLFVYVRWQNYNSSAAVLYGSNGVIESRAVLLKWMEQDPVDTWELGRNDSCQSITGTRNVFVDYPELAFLMLGADVPDNYQSPSGVGGAVAYNITAKSNNTTYGTVSLSGKTITATPKTGYYASGYTVTSGKATVTQEGNTFRVNPETDCTITINFAAKTAVKLNFMENGVISQTINSYGGDFVTLPSNKNAAAEGYTFIGWTDSLLSDTTTKPSSYTPGTSVSASAKTYYALYTYSVGGTGVTEWTAKDITEIKAGDVFMITMAKNGKIYALPNTAASSAPAPVIVDVSVENQADKLLWNIGGSKDAWTFYPNGDTSRWLSAAADNAGVRVDTGANKTFKINSNYLYNNGTGRYFGVYNEQDWRCYTSIHANIANQTLGFYVKSESGVLYYTSSTYVCEHEDSGATDAEAATCTQSGYTAGVYCNDCEQFISGHEEIPALGHSWGAWVQTTAPTCTAAGVETATCTRCSETKTQSVAATGHSYSSVVTKPTETTQGYTTHTCVTCGHSYVDGYTDALGETFYVSFSVPEGVTAIATMESGKNGIMLPAAGTLEGFTFLGWTTAPVEDADAKPAAVLAGSYTATQNTTLYALYSYSVGGTGTANYSKVTTVPADWSGQYVIVYEAGSCVFDSTLTTLDAKGNNKSVTITNNTISAADGDKYAVTIEAVSNGYSIKTLSGYYIGATGNSNSLNSNKTTVFSNTLSMNTDGSVNVIGSGGAYLRFNPGEPRFRYYKSSTYTGQKAIALYVKGEAGTTYYTTLTPQAPAEPTVELTHISLNPGKDALGFKAAAANLPEGAQVAIRLWVNENIVVTKSVKKANISLLLKNIMACNGGEMTIYAQAAILDAEGAVLAESAVEQTTMRETVEKVNELTGLTNDQKAAVYGLYAQYANTMDAWLGENNNIKTWASI